MNPKRKQNLLNKKKQIEKITKDQPKIIVNIQKNMPNKKKDTFEGFTKEISLENVSNDNQSKESSYMNLIKKFKSNNVRIGNFGENELL